MSERAAGYVTELPYTPGYHEGLDPGFVARRLGELGYAAPPIRRACELGFGRGINLAIHSVAGSIEWWGNDLLPVHVESVRALTLGLTHRLHVTTDTFAELLQRRDLPDFDFIGLHGVWSWVSAENREYIRQFIERYLSSNGVVYLSYNVLAGWAPVLPLRDFLRREFTRPEVGDRPVAERIELALCAAQAYVASEPTELEHHPEFERHLRRIRHQRKAYLAHEYFNRDWAPMPFSEVAGVLCPLGLVYAGQVSDARPPASDVRSEDEADQGLRRSFRRDLWLRRPAPYLSHTIEPVAGVDRVAATAALNDRLLNVALHEPQLSVVGSPLTGAGVDLGWRGMLALAAWRAGARAPAEIAARIAERLRGLRHPLLHDGTVIEDAQEAESLLVREAQDFCEHTLPRLREWLIEPPEGG